MARGRAVSLAFMTTLFICVIQRIGGRGNASFEIHNNCSYTVWAAGSPGGGKALASGESWTVEVELSSLSSISGRFWGRTGCSFDSIGQGSCKTGDCGGLSCQRSGKPPATMVEYFSEFTEGYDNYDIVYNISLVDGFNLPVSVISLDPSCFPVTCNRNISAICPAELRVPDGCNSACTRFNTPQYCCTGEYLYNSCRDNKYSRIFKNLCPQAYTYPGNDATSRFTCSAFYNFTIVFCGDTATSLQDNNIDERGNFGEVYFDYKALRDSTGNFDRNNMLGKGGFGEVYKGRLLDGRDVAVKKLNGKQTNQAAEEFLTEVKLISSVRHRNLVRLLGCCKRGHERLLVYEFMSNNSLDKHLFGEIRNPLRWESRLKIIVGTARGLAYLHGDSDVRIIHRDIKCANILLDHRFHPKIADFGLARFFPESQTHVSTRVGGTIGYTAPEYAVHGQLTEKADVYSYGIVVLEIVSGRKCLEARLPAHRQLLLEWAWNQFEQNQVLDIVDPLLEGQYSREQALQVITIALLCTQGSWTQRPAMSKVVLMLTDNSESTGQPTRPAFIDAAADRSANITPIPESATSAAAPTQGSHGSISVSLHPR